MGDNQIKKEEEGGKKIYIYRRDKLYNSHSLLKSKLYMFLSIKGHT